MVTINELMIATAYDEPVAKEHNCSFPGNKKSMFIVQSQRNGSYTIAKYSTQMKTWYYYLESVCCYQLLSYELWVWVWVWVWFWVLIL